MSYDCGGVVRLNYYSTPDISFNGYPIGVSPTDPNNAACNVLSINNTAHTVEHVRTPPAAPPAAPTSLTATATVYNAVTLGWADNAGNEMSYKVERSPNGNHSWTQIATVGANVVQFTDTGLSATTRSAIQAPTGLTATAPSCGQVNLSWTDNAWNETWRDIERSTDGTAWTLVGAVAAPVVTFCDAGLQASAT